MYYKKSCATYIKDIGQKMEGEWHKQNFQIWIFTKIFKITEFVSGKTPNKKKHGGHA